MRIHRVLIILTLTFIQSHTDLNHENHNSLSVCLSVCPSVCLSLASDSSETIEVIIVNLGTVAASDMRMHRILSILTLTFIQGHTDRSHENNICLIISDNIQAMPIKFAVKIVRLKVYII